MIRSSIVCTNQTCVEGLHKVQHCMDKPNIRSVSRKGPALYPQIKLTVSVLIMSSIVLTNQTYGQMSRLVSTKQTYVQGPPRRHYRERRSRRLGPLARVCGIFFRLDVWFCPKAPGAILLGHGGKSLSGGHEERE